MNLSRTLTLSTMITLMLGCGSAVAAENAAPDGALLFKTKACFSCHGADARTPIQPLYPKVAGQNADYLYNQMIDIKSSARNNGQSIVMLGIMQAVTEQEMRAIADWLSTQ